MTISFLHPNTTATQASYRYRALVPSTGLDCAINDPLADVVIFAKPHQSDLAVLTQVQADGRRTIVDSCDVHWNKPSIRTMMERADVLTANTSYMAALIHECFGRHATVIDDAYAYPEVPPHCHGTNLLWFGHSSNAESFTRIARLMQSYSHRVCTTAQAVKDPTHPSFVEWSVEALADELSRADIVLIPETAPHKSANRTIEATRQGCFVIAEPHPSLVGFPGIWIGNIKEGLAWTASHLEEARYRTSLAQDYVRSRYSPERVVNAWRTLVTDSMSMWAAEESIGRDGSTSRPIEALTMPM